VAEEDDVSARFFIGGKHAVVIGVEETKHFRVGLFSPAVLENADVSVLGNGLLDALRELNRAMMGIVMTYKTTHETDDNVGRRSGGIGADYCSIDGSSQRGDNSGQDC